LFDDEAVQQLKTANMKQTWEQNNVQVECGDECDVRQADVVLPRFALAHAVGEAPFMPETLGNDGLPKLMGNMLTCTLTTSANCSRVG